VADLGDVGSDLQALRLPGKGPRDAALRRSRQIDNRTSYQVKQTFVHHPEVPHVAAQSQQAPVPRDEAPWMHPPARLGRSSTPVLTCSNRCLGDVLARCT
jgi:hypothetical protein